MMPTSQMIFLLLFISAWTVSCFPSKPLNERSTQLTWQAWLLIDESQNKQDNTLRRRITPKSVFIAPTFSPESLPECSEGYQSDSMGRCIKIIMLNKELHLDFLLQQLNQKFGGMEDYEDEEETTSGPVNINIPLNGEITEETEVAIVVAPTNNILQNESGIKVSFNETLKNEKMNVEDIAGILGVSQIGEVESTTITSTTDVDTEGTTLESTTKQVETTTMDDSVAKLNALFFLDPKRQVEIKTDFYDDSTTVITTTGAETTELDGQSKRETTVAASEINTEIPLFQMDQALPYDTSVTFIDTKREAIEPNEEQTTESLSTYNNLHQQAISSETISPKKVDELQTTPPSTPILIVPLDNTLSNQEVIHTTQSSEKSTKSIFSAGFKKPDFQTLYNSNNLKFLTHFGGLNSTEKRNIKKNSESVIVVKEDTTVVTEDDTLVTTTDSEIFTTDVPKITNLPESTTSESTIPKYSPRPQVSQLVRFPDDGTAVADDPISKQLETARQFQAIFSKYVHTRGADLAGNQRHLFKNNPSTSHIEPQTLYQRYRAHRENHRNREKHSEWFHLPPKWTDTTQPVVLRFSRKHGSFIDSQQLGSNNFYREIDPRLFGFPTKSRTKR